MITEQELISLIKKEQVKLRQYSYQAQEEAFWRIAHFLDAAVKELDKIKPTITKKQLQEQARIRTCVNCKHIGVDPGSEPCHSCSHQNTDKWEEQ